MLELALALALMQNPPPEPPNPPDAPVMPPPPSRPQDPAMIDETARRMAELRAEMDQTKDPERRRDLEAQLAKLNQDMMRMGPRRRFDVSDEEFARMEEKALPFLKETFPDEYAEITRAKDGGKKEHYRRMVIEGHEHMQGLLKLKETDPKSYDREIKTAQIEQKSRTLAEKIRRAKSDDEREDTKRDLRKALADLFDLREERQKQEIEMLQKQIEKLNERLTKRRDNKERIVDKRLGEMIGEREALDW